MVASLPIPRSMLQACFHESAEAVGVGDALRVCRGVGAGCGAAALVVLDPPAEVRVLSPCRSSRAPAATRTTMIATTETTKNTEP